MNMGITIITGAPGIGKTSLLKAIFQLRANANLPTIFIRSAESGIVYKNGKAGRINSLLTTHLQANLPQSTWVLVDSNSNLKTIPEEVLDTGFFIIQAASPRPERLVTKCDDPAGAQLCVMEPWSLWELIIGQTVQLRPSIPERLLVEFYDRFGGSARDAYVHALDQENFQKSIDSLTFPADTIRSLSLKSTSAAVAVPDNIGSTASHHLRPLCTASWRRDLHS
ncbi:hypothetical protein B0H19DRAFT_499724 [Mycena capillaripes]|nr:hypothetical protein B0H19DRAFT_499724 [Mycena capillaripes]